MIKFEIPECEVIRFGNSDIVVASISSLNPGQEETSNTDVKTNIDNNTVEGIVDHG